MKPIDYTSLQACRNYVQDVARVMGKMQQVFLPPDAHDWHRGLVVEGDGLKSQELGEDLYIRLDLPNGVVSLADQQWDISKVSPQALFTALQAWLTASEVEGNLALPEFGTNGLTFDPSQAQVLAEMLVFANAALGSLRQKIEQGLLSPVLLYPHHFDVSLSWFPNQDNDRSSELQYTFGFSTGDATINEPYFYVTTYPNTELIATIDLPAPAFWQQQDFSGAVLKYNDLVSTSNPEQLVSTFWEAFLR